MSKNFQDRSLPLFGEEGLNRLQKAHVMVLGLGGVGGNAAEALCRGGIGTLSLVDPECFDETNLNRQLFATRETLGNLKVEEAKKRLLSINPQCRILSFPIFYSKTSEPDHFFEGVDYILDAIDSVPSKLDLIERARELSIPIISCMGTGNKLDPTAFTVDDIHKTSVCPLAKKIRQECKKRGIKKLKVLYSREETKSRGIQQENHKIVPASASFVPGVAGMILAGEIIKDIANQCLS